MNIIETPKIVLKCVRTSHQLYSTVSHQRGEGGLEVLVQHNPPAAIICSHNHIGIEPFTVFRAGPELKLIHFFLRNYILYTRYRNTALYTAVFYIQGTENLAEGVTFVLAPCSWFTPYYAWYHMILVLLYRYNRRSSWLSHDCTYTVLEAKIKIKILRLLLQLP